MENTKKCPVGLDGFQHYCPDDPGNHEPLSKIKSYLERKFEGKTEADIAEQPWNKKRWETLQFISGGCKGERPKTQLAEAQTPSKAEAPTITATQQEAMNALAKLKSGIPFTRSYPQTEIREPEPQKPTMSFEEEILHSWQNDSALQREFTSFNSYASFMKAQREGRAKIHRGSVAR
ncbi:MAG: hypothetical protein DYG83_03390 [Candidatus Brocadia sp. AMX2]|uniref:Uncharacterized protein n=1 Tax=Candidatus Brocadia sinica JPN1 TaxID=1197129 RepID=A0ABQ0JZF8_9BACT|nr:hypothetical protein [Candidatus Brocadia sinica]MBC6931289.1 hypothetical protein [Candidatus Brocadia sp.]MCE7865868.1 hypothetical protein [Candidatus Brocadia sp. AMX2]NOG40073.1 hypothetical protein [Planctomycetota bacterium]KXK25487.1 MAG: hypothetical protein UZ01_03291 [Candidatus Brocadia sinica]RIJ92834.1 MAG: hypothetical protein DB853_03900 [Candidatus Brocadia sp.]